MARMKRPSPVNPTRIVEDLWGALRAQVVIAATDLEIFSHVASGKEKPADIARAARAAPRATERLLDALVGLGYLKKSAGKYRLEPVSREFLVKSSPAYVGGLVDDTRAGSDRWDGLAETVKTGRHQLAVNSEAEGAAFFARLARAIFPLSYGSAQAAASAIPKAAKGRIEKVLDVAAGAAPWSIAFAQQIPGARVTALDFPGVLPVAEVYARHFGVDSRFDFMPGNAREADFGRAIYDLVILGHIIHSEGVRWGKRLIVKSFRALRPGGMLLIAEMIPNDARTGPPLPLLFGLNMLLHTEEGDVFTMKEYRDWLKGAGFKTVRTVDVPAPSPLILATKPAA